MPGLRADQVKEALRRKHGQEIFFTEVKTGPTMAAAKGDLQKIDALAVKPSWSNPCFTAYEVKVARSDFLQDSKWANYRNYCHKFYFACPSGLIKPDELPDDVGLVWVNDDLGWSVRRAARFRPLEIPWQMLYYLVISRSDKERHPFFSSRREQFEAYVDDKDERRRLSYQVSRQFRDLLDASEKRITEAERKVKAAERALEVVEVLKSLGINFSGWMWQDDLRRRMQPGSATQQTLAELQRASECIHRALRDLKLPQTKAEVG